MDWLIDWYFDIKDQSMGGRCIISSGHFPHPSLSVYLPSSLSIYLSAPIYSLHSNPSIYLSIYLSVPISSLNNNPSIYPSIYYLSIYRSIYLSTYLSIYLSIYLYLNVQGSRSYRGTTQKCSEKDYGSGKVLYTWIYLDIPRYT